MTTDAAYHLSAQERERFESTGFLIVPDALEPARVRRLVDVGEACRVQLEADGRTSPGGRVLLLDVLGLDPAVLELIDLPTTFPKVWGLLGWNIQLFHSHLCIAPGIEPGSPCVEHYLHRNNPRLDNTIRKASHADTWQWHRDGGRLNFELGEAPPRVSLKVAFLLTDASEDECGNMYVVPKSHLDRDVVPPADAEGPWSRAVPIRGTPGTAVIFDRRLYHSPSPNWSRNCRQVLTLGYAYRWLRPRDDMVLDADTLQGIRDPIRRQLLGVGRGNYGYSSPTAEDVPLRARLERLGLSAEERPAQPPKPEDLRRE
jgi:ectoine hydroxylase